MHSLHSETRIAVGKRERKECRAVVCGNFEERDPTEQIWTAQAETSSVMAGLRLSQLQEWDVFKLDVKGALLNTPLPPDELILVQQPAQWVDWGIVGKDASWKLNRAVYGLRQSPKWWSDERDRRAKDFRRSAGDDHYYLAQHGAGTQVWSLRREGHPHELH